MGVGGYGGVPTLPGMPAMGGAVSSTSGREGSLDGSGMPLAPGAVAIPGRSHHGMMDPALAAAAGSLGTSPGLGGPSPALTKSGLDDHAAATAAAAPALHGVAVPVPAAAAAAAGVGLPAVPGLPAISIGIPSGIVAVSTPLAAVSGGGMAAAAAVRACGCQPPCFTHTLEQHPTC